MSSRFTFDTDNTNDVFEFTIKGKDYNFVYPTMKEIEPFSDLVKEIQDEQAKDTPDADHIKELEKRSDEAIYGFIKPIGHETPIKETLDNCSIKLRNEFNKKIISLLSE